MTVTVTGLINFPGFPDQAVDGDVLSNSASVVASDEMSGGMTVETTNIIDPPFTLNVTKSVSPTGPVDPGTTLTYTVTVTVTGTGTATGVVLTETYDAAFVFLSTDTVPTTGDNVWNLGSLAGGSSQTIVITGTVSLGATPGSTVANNVEVTAANAPFDTASATNTVSGAPAAAPILEIFKTDDADPRQVGDTLVYDVRVENNGNATADNIVITETYPPFFTFGGATELGVLPITPTGPENNIFSNFVLLSGSDLLAGNDFFIRITGTVAAGAPGSLVNNVSVAADNFTTPATTDETTTIGAAPPTAPVLEVTKTDTPDPVAPGATLAYQLIVRNTGTGTATDVTVNETYPPEFTFGSAVPTPTTPPNAWALGSIDQGDEVVIDITGTVSNMAPNGATLLNNVAVTSTNAATANTSENTTVSTAATQLQITKTDSVDPIAPGATLVYSVRVENTGAQAATNVVVTETFPALFTPSEAKLNGVAVMIGPGSTFALDTVAPGAASAKTLIITGTVGAAALDGNVLTNSVTATADNAGDATTSETTIVTAPTLTVTNTDNTDPVPPGGALTYTVTITNTGTATATNVVLTETYPMLFTFGSATPAPTTGDNIFALGALAGGTSTVVTINGTVDASAADTTVLTNAVTASADNAASAMTNETTTVAAGGLAVTKSDNVNSVAPGGPLEYTVVITNTGTGAATNLVLTEAYPPLFTFVSSVPVPTTGDNVFALGTLAAGATTTVVITGTVSPMATSSDVLTNTATASADTAADSTATETSPVSVPTTQASVAAATGTGPITVTLTGGGPTCELTSVTATTALAAAGGPPPGVGFPHGLVQNTITSCVPGATVTLAVTYPTVLPPGTQYWKYGPRPGFPVGWYLVPATIVGNTATFALTDGGSGDDDLTVNGTIVDPGGAGVAPAVPVMPWWALALLVLGLAWSARTALRRRAIAS